MRVHRYEVYDGAIVEDGLIGWSDPGGDGPNVSILIRSLVWWEEDVVTTTTTLHLHNGDVIVVDFVKRDGGQVWSDFNDALMSAHAAPAGR